MGHLGWDVHRGEGLGGWSKSRRDHRVCLASYVHPNWKRISNASHRVDMSSGEMWHCVGRGRKTSACRLRGKFGHSSFF